MRAGKNASQAQPATPNEGPRASGSGTQMSGPESTDQSASGQQNNSRSSNTIQDEESEQSSGITPSSNSEFYQNILVECNALVEEYRKGEIPKATVYVEIQSKLVKALGDDRARTDAAFGAFIATIESHDSEVEGANKRGRVFDSRRRSASPAGSDADEQQSDGEPVAKKPRTDDTAYAWVAGRRDRRITLSDNLT